MSEDMNLEDVLEGYAMDCPEGNDPQILRKWISEYPQFSDDLRAFAADRSRIRHLPDPVLSDEEIAAAMLRGRAALDQVRDETAASSAPITSLMGLAKKRGITKAAFAESLGLSLSLLVQLDKRRIEASTVPEKLSRKISEKIDVAHRSVLAFLERPQEVTQANFKAEERPAPLAKKDFADAVRDDVSLTEDQKKALLE